MLNQTLPADLPATIQLTGFICQICTTLIAAQPWPLPCPLGGLILAAHPHGESTPKPPRPHLPRVFCLFPWSSEAAGRGICVRSWNPRALSLPSRSPGGTAAGSASVLQLRRAPPDRRPWPGRGTR